MNNFAKVTLYYQNLSMRLTSQIKVYSVIDVLSSIGGTMGLCLGISVITICEFLNLILTLISTVFRSNAADTVNAMCNG